MCNDTAGMNMTLYIARHLEINTVTVNIQQNRNWQEFYKNSNTSNLLL